MSEDTATNNELHRALGRIEGNVSTLLATTTLLQATVTAVQVGVASILQDNVQCHQDRVDHGKRINAVERRQYWTAGAGTVAGMLAGYIVHLFGVLPH